MSGSVRLLVGPSVLALLLAACAGEDATPVASDRWHVARLQGTADLQDVAVLGDDLLLVCGGGERTVRVVARSRLADGASLAPVVVPLAVVRTAKVGGSDPFAGPDSFAARGYTVGDLWDPPIELVGVAAAPPDVLWLAERNHRVVYWGKLRRGPAGAVVEAMLDRAFAVPGGDRSGRGRSDWRDASPGLAAITTVPGRRGPEDLVLVDRQGEPASSFRVWQMDRYGILGWYLTVRVPGDAAADVRGVAPDGAGRLVVVRGPGGGVLTPFALPSGAREVRAGPGPEGPVVPGVAAWTGVARAPDGTEYLVGADAVAWRSVPVAPPPAR